MTDNIEHRWVLILNGVAVGFFPLLLMVGSLVLVTFESPLLEIEALRTFILWYVPAELLGPWICGILIIGMPVLYILVIFTALKAWSNRTLAGFQVGLVIGISLIEFISLIVIRSTSNMNNGIFNDHYSMVLTRSIFLLFIVGINLWYLVRSSRLDVQDE